MSVRSSTCILLPTLNEAPTIGAVIDGFLAEGFADILVIDGNSTDGTRTIARQHGARVRRQSGTGKGQAIREARHYITQPYVLMVDGDATYRPTDATRLLAPLARGDADHVIGNRFAGLQPGAMTRLNGVGNHLINIAFATVHREAMTDVLSGYRAFTRDSFDQMELRTDGFSIETEIAVECVRLGLTTQVVPIEYYPRPAGSAPNLSPHRDGARIGLTLYQRSKTSNPQFYYGSIGIALLLIGSIGRLALNYNWLTSPATSEFLPFVTVGLLVLGLHLVVVGVLTDRLVPRSTPDTESDTVQPPSD